MIPTKTERDILRSGTFQEQKMGIAKGSEAWIFNILRNSTYTDKIGSPLREYIANALDEHQKLGKTHVPVEVTFPTAFSNEVRIRDKGAGLSDEDVVKYFANYGASDKRESNDLIGAFGIGCKSAFAYTDQFTIISYKDGVKTTFNMYIDETDIGSIAKLLSTETDEPNGIEIIIPVRPQDVSTFRQRGLALMKYFKTKPLIKGIENVPDFTREVSPVFGENWKYFGDGRGSIVIQGQIGYPIDVMQVGNVSYNASETAALPAGYIHQWEDSLLRSGLEIEVNIGDVEVTASRESLQMTPKTINAIRSRLAEIRAEIVDKVSEIFKSSKTLVEAKTAYYNFFLKGGSYGYTLKTSIGTVKWNGMEIRDNVINLGENHKVFQYTKKYNGNIVLTTFDKLKCSDDLNLYFDDTDRKSFMYRRRAKTLLDAGASQVTVLQTDNKTEFKKETGIDANKLPKFSTVTPTILASTRIGGTGVDPSKRVKHKVKVFELDWATLKNNERVKGALSDYWKVAEIETDKQVYVPIDRFRPSGVLGDSLKELRAILVELSVLGVDVTSEPIYGIKAGIDTGDMVRVDVWLKDQIAKIPNLAEDVAFIRDYKTRSPFTLALPAKDFPKESLAAKYATEHAKMQKLMEGSSYYYDSPKVIARLHLAKIAELSVPNEGKLIKLSKEFLERYPLFEICSEYNQKQWGKHFVEYVKLIDEARG